MNRKSAVWVATTVLLVVILAVAGYHVWQQVQSQAGMSLIALSTDGDARGVRKLLSHGVINANYHTLQGGTALQFAAAHGRTDVVSLLCQAGAHVNDKDPLGTTALTQAILNGHDAIVKVLLAAGADANAAGYPDWPPICLAARFGHREELDDLLKFGANINARRLSNNGDTPLMYAAAFHHKDCVDSLLRQGADATLKNDQGDTALSLALQKKYADIALVLSTAKK
jgi:ankyrin repeat protein